MEDMFTENYRYKLIYYISLMFGTCMTFTSKTHKIVANTISLIWCLVIVGNQINYFMKPWMEESNEKRQKDMTFEKIIRFDFWTYNVTYFLSCFFPLISDKIKLNTMRTTKNLENVHRTWRVVIIFLLVVRNLIPAFCSYNFQSIKKKANSTYNLLFQDFCKLGILTVDLQFVWFCWSLEDILSKLNDDLQLIISLEVPEANARWNTVTTRNNYRRKLAYNNEISQVNILYGKLIDSVKIVNSVCEERILMNILCYMFNTICGLFNTISTYRTQGTPLISVIVHLLWVINCASRIAVVCCAASTVVEQDGRLHILAQTAKGALGMKSNCLEMKQFSQRLIYCKVKFDVCGIVTVDKTLLSSAVISVISYLVIVLQYNYS